ncbi:MAG: hypothetical protein N3A58_03935 [Spirochaetes bacterium]|nr:hypothetical protein [Spirochaetota bacterium]
MVKIKYINFLIFLYFIFNSSPIFCQEVKLKKISDPNSYDFKIKYKLFSYVFYKFLEDNKYFDYNNYYFKLYNPFFIYEIKNYYSFAILLNINPFYQSNNTSKNLINHIQTNSFLTATIITGYFTFDYSTNFFSGIKSIFPFDLIENIPRINFGYKIFYNFDQNFNNIFETINNYNINYFLNIKFIDLINIFLGNIKNSNGQNYQIYGIYLSNEIIKTIITFEEHNYTIKIFNKEIEKFNRIIFAFNINLENISFIIETPYVYFNYMNYYVYYFDAFFFIKIYKIKYVFIYKNFNYNSENFFNENFMHNIIFEFTKSLIINFYLPYRKDDFKLIADKLFIRTVANIDLIKTPTILKILSLNLEGYFYPKSLINNTNYFIITQNDYYYRFYFSPILLLNFSKYSTLEFCFCYDIYKEKLYEFKLKVSYKSQNNIINFIYYENNDINKHMYIFSKFTQYDFNFLNILPKEKLLEISFENSLIFNSIFLKLIYIFNDKNNKVYLVVGIYYAY